MNERSGPYGDTTTLSSIIHGDALSTLDSLEDQSFQLIVTSPPYNIGKEYERDKRRTLPEYIEWLKPIARKACDKITEDGSLCWQVGNYVNNGEVFPLDLFFYNIFAEKGLKLRNRIVWHFNFGLHANQRFSGRYETLLWFTKSDKYKFNLDPVRVPQLYPGKRHAASKLDKAGLPSGNPLGKNPSDFWEFEPQVAFLDNPIWEIPNVKSKHPEKTSHPCQFPSELVERCVLAFTDPGDKVLDPFVGVGTSVIAAMKHGRIGTGIDQSERYVRMAQDRVASYLQGDLKVRPAGMEVRRPRSRERVATIPEEWKYVNTSSRGVYEEAELIQEKNNT